MSSINTDIQQPLPQGFAPGPKDVVIGKGKKFYFHEGNTWLREVVSSMLDEYKKATTKPDKSLIISDVVDVVRCNGRFVKLDLRTDEWVYAEELLCREKCSQTFRDALHDTYKSSNVAKKNKRRREQQKKVVTEMTLEPETKRPRPMLSTPAHQIEGFSNLFEWDMSSPQVGFPRMATLSRTPPTSGHDIVSILADALSVSNIDIEDDNPFEPTPFPDSTPPSFATVANPFDDTSAAIMSHKIPALPIPPDILKIPAAFFKDGQCHSEPRPLLSRGYNMFVPTPATFKGEDSFDELSTISDIEAFRMSNEESYDLGPNIHAAFAA